MSQLPPIEDFVPETTHSEYRRRPRREKYKSSDAFRFGFYAGLGLWCSIMALNVAFIVIGWIVLLILGGLGLSLAFLAH